MKTLVILVALALAYCNGADNGIVTYDYYEALKLAEQSDKTILLVFTAKNCDNPKLLNDLLENDVEISRELKSYVTAILYVDDKTELSKEKKVLRHGKKIILRTKGNEWGHIQISKYGSNRQPFMILVDSDENLLAEYEGRISKLGILRYLNP